MAQSEISFTQFARLVLDAMEAVGVTYLVGGSVGLWAWGQLRTTQDIDLVIDLPVEQIYKLSKELERRDMLVPYDIIIDLMIAPGDLPINAIHLHSAYKAELFLLKEGDAFRRSSLARRRLVDLELLGQVYVHAPEDLMINKIYYYGLSWQPKHVRDIASILELSGEEIDWDYFQQWIETLNLTSTWHSMQAEIEQL